MQTKIMRLLVAAAFALGFGQAYAFHDGGVAECAGCHSMHSPAVGGHFLLIKTDQSSTCLSCHGAGSTTSSYHIATIPLPASGIPQQFTPGGDFSYLGKTYTWLGRGTPAPTVSEAGQTHGHNVNAADYASSGFVTDTDNPQAPGGTFDSSTLGCQSCHDPHGQLRRTGTDASPVWATTGAPIAASGSYANSPEPGTGNLVGAAVGAYRILRGSGGSYGGASFPTVPLAIAPATYNQSEGTNQVRVAYGSSGNNTWGQWCGSCHPGMHNTAYGAKYVHPIDHDLGVTISGNYNSYVSSGILGANANPYLSLVPFAEATGSLATLKTHASNTGAFNNGPATTAQVMCLSCHRAHASGFPEAVRWNIEYELLTTQVAGVAKYPGTDLVPTPATTFSVGRTQADWQAAYYNRDPSKLASAVVAVGYQRSLCNKCHAKD